MVRCRRAEDAPPALPRDFALDLPADEEPAKSVAMWAPGTEADMCRTPGVTISGNHPLSELRMGGGHGGGVRAGHAGRRGETCGCRWGRRLAWGEVVEAFGVGSWSNSGHGRSGGVYDQHRPRGARAHGARAVGVRGRRALARACGQDGPAIVDETRRTHVKALLERGLRDRAGGLLYGAPLGFGSYFLDLASWQDYPSGLATFASQKTRAVLRMEAAQGSTWARLACGWWARLVSQAGHMGLLGRVRDSDIGVESRPIISPFQRRSLR